MEELTPQEARRQSLDGSRTGPRGGIMLDEPPTMQRVRNGGLAEPHAGC